LIIHCLRVKLHGTYIVPRYLYVRKDLSMERMIIYTGNHSFFMGAKSWIFNKISKKQSVPVPLGNVNRVEKDAAGNYWYLSDLFGKRFRWKADYDMTNDSDKAEALLACTPFFTVVDKIGTMMSRGVPYVTDAQGNEKSEYSDIRDLLNQPNPLQTFSSFIKQVEISLKAFGYCPISVVRAARRSTPKAMWVLPAELFHLEGTGKFFRQHKLEEVVSRAYIEWGGIQSEFQDYEYFIIYDALLSFNSNSFNADIEFETATDSLSQPVSNWVASMSASHTLLVNGGPKGILCNDYDDEMGNVAMEPDDEKEIKDKFKEKFGLVNKEYPILVTRKKLKWIPLDYNSSQLKLFEEDERCTKKIANAIGVNPSLFDDSKYDNQAAAMTSAYQDVVIPDSRKIAQCITRSICPENVLVKIDFTDVECLQANKKTEADAIVKVADALERLERSQYITHDEGRIWLAQYMDIDPDKPKGNFTSLGTTSV